MAHTGQQVPPRTFSPAQHPGQHPNQPAQSHSPGAQQPGFALPGLPPQGVTPRPQNPPHGRTSSFSAPNAQSQPGSPYSIASPGYPASPNVSTPTNAPSPSYQNLQPAPSQQAPHFAPPSYVNRNPPHNPNINTNFSRPSHIPLSAATAATPSNMASPLTPNPAPGTPGTPGIQQQQQQQQQQQYTNQAFAPAVTAPSTPGTMGPPTGRPQREYEYDVTDSLMGTGVNIRDEENALAEYYAGSYGQDARTGLPANEPGNRASLYGTGFANQPGVDAGGLSQKAFEAQEAERVFNESANRLAVSRALEHNDPFLNFANLHKRMQDVAQSHGLELNLDNKNNPQQAHVQKTKPVADLPVPKLTVTTKVGPDGAIVAINGSVVPTDSFLADQLTLLSLGTKQRVRSLVAECDKLATHRQTTSHGKMPMSWSSEVGKSLEEAGFYDPNDGLNGSGDNGGGEHGPDHGGDEATKRKRDPKPLVPLNWHAQYLREYARADRAIEEERQRKRQKRLADETALQNGSRAGSNAPTTPGSSAPDPDKAPTKKEQKKIAAQKHDASAETVNSTTAKFLGGGKKKYSWMTGGASTPKTPARTTGSAASTPVSAVAPKAPENVSLTPKPKYEMGAWREYSDKGKNIQVRDLVSALERDGKDPIALYKARNQLNVLQNY